MSASRAIHMIGFGIGKPRVEVEYAMSSEKNASKVTQECIWLLLIFGKLSEYYLLK